MKLLEITQSFPPSEAEQLLEAKAWGFDTVEEFDDAMDEAYTLYEQEMLEWNNERDNH